MGAAGPPGGFAHHASYAGSRDGPRGATPTKAATSIRTPVSARKGSSNRGYTPGAPSCLRSRIATYPLVRLSSVIGMVLKPIVPPPRSSVLSIIHLKPCDLPILLVRSGRDSEEHSGDPLDLIEEISRSKPGVGVEARRTRGARRCGLPKKDLAPVESRDHGLNEILRNRSLRHLESLMHETQFLHRDLAAPFCRECRPGPLFRLRVT